MSVCQLSVSAINSYSSYNSSKASGLLSSGLSELNGIISQALSNLTNERNSLVNVVDNAVSYVDNIYNKCKAKEESVSYYLSKTPAVITKTVTKTVTVTNADGSKSTKTVKEQVNIKNPNHDSLVSMLSTVRTYERQVVDCRNKCAAYYDEVRKLDRTISDFRNAAESAKSFAEEIRQGMQKHLEELNSQSRHAADKLKSAKAAAGPFPAINDDKGVVDLNGLGSYISGLQSYLDACEKDADKMVKIAEDLNYGWRDDVYTKFYNDTQNIRSNVMGVVKEFERIKEALSVMRDRLYDYSGVTPNVSYNTANFRYDGASFPPGSGPTSSISVKI